MSDYFCFLITILYEEQLLTCALKAHRDYFSEYALEYPMESENKKIYHNLLPEHVKSLGPIVEIAPLFEAAFHPKPPSARDDITI